jgi:anaerobic ribonucleoside-triphosphate reductase activating protein
MSETNTLQIAQIIPCTEAEGPGKRFAVWFQGCPLRCSGCCNPEFLPFSGGETRTVSEVASAMLQARDAQGIEGITLLGGEPFAHAAGAAALAGIAREYGLSVMVFTGYTLEELQSKPDAAELLAATDILVDGPYLRDQPDSVRRWIGSTNQRIHFLTDRYQFDDQWRQRNTLEIRVIGTEIHVNGFPAPDAVGLWKGWKRKTPTASGSPTR